MHKGYYFPDRFERIPPNPIQTLLFPPSIFVRRATPFFFFFSPLFLSSSGSPHAFLRIYYFLFVYVSIYLLTYPLFCLHTESDVCSLVSIVSFGSFLSFFLPRAFPSLIFSPVAAAERESVSIFGGILGKIRSCIRHSLN